MKEKTEDKKGRLINPFETDDGKLPPSAPPGGGGGKFLDPFAPGGTGENAEGKGKGSKKK